MAFAIAQFEVAMLASASKRPFFRSVEASAGGASWEISRCVWERGWPVRVMTERKVIGS